MIFSAAIPGQGGTHTINEQWPSYWIDLFRKSGFEPLDCIRQQIWTNSGVEWWYAQNTFAFVRATRVADFPRRSPKAELCPWIWFILVHSSALLFLQR